MPPARSIRQRVVNNENDENSASTRVTRAKAAALSVIEDVPVGGKITKKTVITKKSTTTAAASNTLPGPRKRAALGDLSNINKNDVVEPQNTKKPMSSRTGLVSKTTQNAGIQKLSRAGSSRSVLAAKDNNKKTATAELKRPGSGSGVMGGAAKKRQTSSLASQQSLKEDTTVLENESSKTKLAGEELEPSHEIERKEEIVATVVEHKVQPLVHIQEDHIKHEAYAKVADLDAEDIDDPLMVAEYVVEIFDYLKELETATMPNPHYMDHQDHLDWHLRGVLVDWLIEVHTRFHLLPETIFLAVNIIDRFLSTRIVELDKLQLVGITAMFIASKYEEVLSPHVQNFKHVADDGFSEEEILKAERFVLAALNYDLSYPNPMNFLRRISKADNYDITTRTLAKYLLEISLLDQRLMAYHPSHVAAASMYLARLILERGEWDANLAHYSGYSENEIQPVFKIMVDYLRRPVAHEAFFKKYASKKFMKASILTRQWAKKYFPLYLGNDLKTHEANNRNDSHIPITR